MIDPIGQDETLRFLSASMDLLAARHSLLAGNIANVDTPGYRAMDLDFGRELEVAFRRQRSLEGVPGEGASLSYRAVLRPRIVEVSGTTVKPDGNNVDIDRELGQLSRTTAMFQQAISFMSVKLRMLKAAIREGA